MQHHFHVVVWIDHLQARVFHLGLSGLDEVVLHPHMPTRHIHHKANSLGSGHIHESEEFLKQVLDAVSDAGEILILGPAGAKAELAKYIREHNQQVGNRIVAVEWRVPIRLIRKPITAFIREEEVTISRGRQSLHLLLSAT